MDGIVPFRDHPAASVASPSINRNASMAVPTSVPINLAAVKTTSDYLKAMRRRIWLILAVAVPMAIATSIWILRLPRIYRARSRDHDRATRVQPGPFDPGIARDRPP